MEYNDNKTKRVGIKNVNRLGENMEIKEYINANNIIVEFENGYTVKTRYSHFNSGNVKNPYFKICYNIGFIGFGKYKSHENKICTKQYNTWRGMLRRCYDEKYKSKNTTYKDCLVCDEWHNFQNFAKWYDENYYEIENEDIQLDKDILIKGNKIYNAENCIFVPHNINKLFTKTDFKRGNCPIGVCYYKNDNKYGANCNNGFGEIIYLGYYNSEIKAFEVYKEYKENIIKQIADRYKDKIPQNLYKAMYTYIVEMTD